MWVFHNLFILVGGSSRSFSFFFFFLILNWYFQWPDSVSMSVTGDTLYRPLTLSNAALYLLKDGPDNGPPASSWIHVLWDTFISQKTFFLSVYNVNIWKPIHKKQRKKTKKSHKNCLKINESMSCDGKRFLEALKLHRHRQPSSSNEKKSSSTDRWSPGRRWGVGGWGISRDRWARC